jgi:hypothetical protein
MGAWGMLSPLTEEQMNPSEEMVRDDEILQNVIEHRNRNHLVDDATELSQNEEFSL